MKNRIQYKILSQIIITSFGLFFVEILAQMVLSYTFQWKFFNAATKRYWDISKILLNQPGQLTIFYSDFLRIALFGAILIPYMIILMKLINKSVTKPLLAIKDEISSVNDDNLTKRLDLPVQCEFVELQNEFNELMDRLENATNEREKIEKEKMLLLSGMAHDLKTPITTIRGYTQLFRDGLVDNENQRAEYMDAIYQKTIQMDELISMLLDYLRLGTAEYKLQMEPFDLVELIRESIGLVYIDFEERGINFDFDLPESAIMISGDKAQLGRVFENLFSNAIKYTHKSDRVKIEVKVQGDSCVQMIIEDNGEKIPEEIKPYLFDPFVMGDYSRKSGKGNGLGLCIAAKIMQLHHGSIELITKEKPEYIKQFILTVPRQFEIDGK